MYKRKLESKTLTFFAVAIIALLRQEKKLETDIAREINLLIT